MSAEDLITCDGVGKVRKQEILDALLAQLATAKADSERLDWLEKKELGFAVNPSDRRHLSDWWWVHKSQWGDVRVPVAFGNTPREAIDAARKREGGML